MEETNKISFFKKIMISIKDFDRYPELASKRAISVLLYIIKLIAIFTIIVSLTNLYSISKQINSAISYVETQMPDFAFKNNELEVKQTEPIIINNEDSVMDLIIIDTSSDIAEKIQEYQKKVQNSNNGIILLKDKIIIKTQVTSSGLIEYTYESITNNYQIQQFNKQDVLNYFTGTNQVFIYVGIFIISYIYLFMIYFVSISLDILVLGMLAYITAVILRLRLKFSAMCKIAAYAITLPIILNAVAIVIQTFTGFEIKYFEFMYIAIAYIYIITAILMIKSDIIKKGKELAKIIEEQAKIKQEMDKQKEQEEQEKRELEKEKEKQRKKEKEEEKSKKKKEENDTGNEVQGENA